MSDKPSTAAKFGRSPAYPLFGLRTALDKLAKLFAIQKLNAVSIEAAAETLGYQNPKSGYAARTIAALISYGLIIEEGSGPSRKVRVSDLGRKLLWLEDDDGEKLELLREAAMRPKVYRELVDTYPQSLPSDRELRKYLTFERHYNDEAAQSLVETFKETYQFAKLGSDGEPAEQQSTKVKPMLAHPIEEPQYNNGTTRPITGPLKTAGEQWAAPDPAPDSRSLHIPITLGRMAVLELPGAITEDDIKFVEKYLDLMREAIITSKPPRIQEGTATIRLPAIRLGAALWHAKDADYQVDVTGYAGEKDGQHYVTVDGSTTGIPLDEIEYDETQDN